jgi:hypothetical protein
MNKHIPRERIMAPKGFTNHDKAGRKLIGKAKAKTLGVRHPGSLTVIAGRIIRL